MQQSDIFRNEKLHEYRYPAPVCYNHGGKKCQKYVKITAKILIIYVMIITWIPTPVRNVPAWYALLPKIMTNGKATGKFLILSPNRRKAISLPVNNYCIRQESCSNEWFIGGPVCIMKKLLAACVCAGLSFSFAGCSPETILEQFTSTGDTSVRELTSSSDTTTEIETKAR